jgi:type II secretory pathway pseudopilin PulG
MMSRIRSTRRLTSSAGYSLVELVVAMGILTAIMGLTMGGMANIARGNQTVLQMASLNNALRSGIDLIVRDMLQVGSGLPSGHTVTIPNGANSVPVKLPGPPGTAFTTTDSFLPAVIPRPGTGPTISGVATDVLTVLMADNTFTNVALSAVNTSYVDVAAGPNIATGPDRVSTGQLMMISKGSFTTLVQVTNVNTGTRRLTFADGDSLSLNQSAAASGNLASLNAQAPVNSAAATNITRVRMITYYLDATIDAQHPRLVRRINNGDPATFNNNLGTAVAMDIENLFLTYDISNGTNNPGNVRMVAADLGTGGACAPVACAATQIRKINIGLTGRSRVSVQAGMPLLRNTLQSEVALRGMAFVDRYRAN